MASCVATVMEKKYVGEDFYVLIPNHTIVGMIDEETGIFKDSNDNEYDTFNEETIKSEVPYFYYNPYTIDELRDLYKDKSLNECLKAYKKKCKNTIYWSYKTDDGMIVLYKVDKEKYKQASQKAIQQDIKLKEDLESDEDEIEPISIPDTLDLAEEYKERDGKLTIIVTDIAMGKYSLEELKQIKEKLERDNEDNKTIIDSADVGIEALETGKSFSQVADERYMAKENERREEETKKKKEKKEEPVEERPTSVFEEKEEEIELIDTDKLFEDVTKTLVAQDEPLDEVITEIARKLLEKEERKYGILLTGPTGVGKTLMMKLIAKYIDRPFITIDSTQLTVPGYTGRDIETYLWELFIKCGRDIEKAENAIVFFDEIDKKGSEKKSDVNGKGVLNLILKFIEGTEYDACADMKTATNKVKIDTTNMIVAFAGAFADLYAEMLMKNGMGFGSENYDKDTYREPTDKDFDDIAGIPSEFMGRNYVVCLNALDEDRAVKVLLTSDDSAVVKQTSMFKKLGARITFEEDYLRRVAKESFKLKEGVRGMNKMVSKNTSKAFREVYRNAFKHIDEIEEVIITEETFEDPNNYQLVKKNKQ